MKARGVVNTYGDLFALAKRGIERRGWGQRLLEDDDGKVCLWGGISYAAVGTARYYLDDALGDDLEGPVNDRLQRVLPRSTTAPFFNDAPTTTSTDVLRVLDRAAWVYDDDPLPESVVAAINERALRLLAAA